MSVISQALFQLCKLIWNKKIYFFLLFIVCGPTLLAQRTYIDSLKNKLTDSDLPDTSRVLIMTDLAYALYNVYPDTTITYAFKALEISDQLNFVKGKGRALWLLGMDKYFQGDYDEADEYLDQALQEAAAAGDHRELGRIFNSLGELAYERSEIVRSLEYFQKSISHKEKVNDKLGIAISNNKIGKIFSVQAAYEKAHEYNRKSLQLRKDVEINQGLSLVYNDIGNDFLEQERFDSAYNYLSQGLKLSETLGEQWGSANLRKSMARYFLETNQLDSGWAYLEKAEEMAILTGSKDILAELLHLNAVYYNKIGDHEAALEMSIRAIDQGYEIGKALLVKNGLKELGIAQKNVGQYQEAINSYEKYQQLEDSLFNARQNQIVLTSEYEKELTRQRLKNEQEKTLLEKDLGQQKAFSFIIIMMFLFLFLIFILLYRNYQSKQKRNRKLKEKQVEIEEQNRRIEEQNQLLKDQKLVIEKANDQLEDRIKERTTELAETVQKLAEQNQNLEQFSYIVSNNLKASVDRINGLANIVQIGEEKQIDSAILQNIFQSAQNLDNVITDLSQIIKAKTLQIKDRELVDLDETVQSAVDFYKRELDQIDSKIDIFIQPGVEIHSVKSFLYSILINLLSNSIKFRAIRRQLIIDIKGVADGDLYILKVSDNGMGMDLSQGNRDKIFKLYQRLHSNDLGRGFGLYFIKTQIEALGGSIEADSDLNDGAKFTLKFPYKK